MLKNAALVKTLDDLKRFQADMKTKLGKLAEVQRLSKELGVEDPDFDALLDGLKDMLKAGEKLATRKATGE